MDDDSYRIKSALSCTIIPKPLRDRRLRSTPITIGSEAVWDNNHAWWMAHNFACPNGYLFFGQLDMTNIIGPLGNRRRQIFNIVHLFGGISVVLAISARFWINNKLCLYDKELGDVYITLWWTLFRLCCNANISAYYNIL
ncbi:hypothetical protein BU17DRAFT_66802 [Hysterangium stoloniferum]|nr:hypothetical protein BU17DRAFT_66802 [Hysterangium stoloniferum]